MAFEGVFNAALHVFNAVSHATICPTYHVVSDRVDQFDLINDMNELMTAFREKLAPCVRDGFQTWLVTYRTLVGDLDVNGPDELNYAETSGGPSTYPYESCVLVQKRQSDDNVYRKGRFYIPFPKDAYFAPNDLVTADGDLIAFMNFAAGSWIYGASTFTPMVRNSPAARFERLNSCQVSNRIARRKWHAVNHGHYPL